MIKTERYFVIEKHLLFYWIKCYKWDYFRDAFNRDAGIRMDHILLSPDLAKRLKRGAVDRHVRSWEKTSDHAPVWIELKNK